MAASPERTPRIAPVPRGTWSQEAIDATAPMMPPAGTVYAERRRQRGGAGGVNALALLVRNPPLAKAFMTFNRHLLYESRIDERLRELIVLRVSWVLRSEYEWGQHVVVAHQCGINADEVARVREGPEAEGWSELDRAALRATDTLLASGDVDDVAWEALSAALDDETVLELVFTVGAYATLAMAFNVARLPLDEGLEGFPGGG